MKEQLQAFYVKHQVVLRVLFVLSVSVALVVVGGAPGAGSGGPSMR